MLKRSLAACSILASATCSALPSSAAIFPVTKNFWGDHATQGTLSWAIQQSNITPGRDEIYLTTDVSIDDFIPTPGSDRARYAADITDTSGLVILGNGHKLTGEPSFIDTVGVVRTKTNPAPFVAGDVLVNQAYPLARVADNISFLEVDALTVDGLNEFLNIGKAANVFIRNSVIRNMGAFGDPARPLFTVNDDSTLSLLGVSIKNINRFGYIVEGFEYAWSSMIQGMNASLNIQKSILDLYISATDGAVAWKGGVVNVVSSQILGKGLSISDGLKEGVLNMVNSVFRPVGHSSTARIQAYGGGEANLIASTIQFDASDTSDVPRPSNPFFSCPSNYRCNGAPLQAYNGGTINLHSSAVSVLSTDDAHIGNPYSDTYDALPGTLTADATSFVQPVTDQDSATLKNLFGQPKLITVGVPYALDSSDPFFPHYFDLAAGATPLAPGPLRKVIRDADGAN